jgi:NAD-dependent DNA ligase
MNEFSQMNSHRNLTKAMQTLLGICRGLTADNHLNDAEIQFLSTWIADNKEATVAWPGCVIRDRVAHVLEDGQVTDEEREQLLTVVKELCGSEFMETGSAEAAPVSFPTEDVCINLDGATFCLTGKFIFGPRSSVERVIENKGGLVGGNVTQKTDYLIIGTLSSPDWLHSNHGLKIQKAVELKQAGQKIFIITEKAWLEAVQ